MPGGQRTSYPVEKQSQLIPENTLSLLPLKVQLVGKSPEPLLKGRPLLSAKANRNLKWTASHLTKITCQ
jgi:hypothetical protein